MKTGCGHLCPAFPDLGTRREGSHSGGKNTRVPDDVIIEKSCASGFILLTKDQNLESDWIEDVIKHCARIILLEMLEGSVVHMASALICSHKAWERALLNTPLCPLVIRMSDSGKVRRIKGEAELRAFRDRLVTQKKVREKRQIAVIAPDGTHGKAD